MKQLLQDLKTGNILLEEVPLPNYGPNEVLIKTQRSLISPGTERMLLEFGKSSYIQKAKQQPEKVKMVIDKIKTDGLVPTVKTVFAKLDEPIPLGYCNAGVVIAVGRNVENFKVGDRVVSNGPHSEIVAVGKNLVAKIPDNVSDESATFTVIASIALQGIRLMQPTLGEKILVIGLGLIGQITLDLLKVSGCDAIGVDIDQSKVNLANSRGFNVLNANDEENVRTYIANYTKNIGVDGVIITAASKSNMPIELASQVVRKKGRIVAVGAVSMNIPRTFFYEKELSFHVSCSYGPGRYDTLYEEKGIDYPIAYVRWTENRNFQAILNLISDGRLNFDYLITHRYRFIDAAKAYDEILNNNKALGVILEYDDIKQNQNEKKVHILPNRKTRSDSINVGIIGAGNFTKLIVIPILKKLGVNLIGISSYKGLSSSILGKKYGFEYCTTEYKDIIKDDRIDTLFITTRHNTHASLVIEALEAGKNVFVEKPLAINMEQLSNILKICNKLSKKNKLPKLMVGFNRRFSPFITDLYERIKNRHSQLIINMIINAGFLPDDLWIHDPEIGGGRVIGECCHFINTMSYLTKSEVESVYSMAINTEEKSVISNDNVVINIKFKNGSIGTLTYAANGNKTFPKEQTTIFCNGTVLVQHNYKKNIIYNGRNYKKFIQDKGHKNEIKCFIENLKTSKKNLIPLDSIINTTLATFAHVRSLKENRVVQIRELENELYELIK
jgi:predicted dehydrogenase/threonine dehydrogenase-like Zn-dependent dehydrogenase